MLSRSTNPAPVRAMTADVLVKLAEAAARVGGAVVERDRLVVLAVRVGFSRREVGRVAGLSHTTVQRIVREG